MTIDIAKDVREEETLQTLRRMDYTLARIVTALENIATQLQWANDAAKEQIGGYEVPEVTGDKNNE